MAQSGHANGAERCLLSRVKRTWRKDGLMSAYDPQSGQTSYDVLAVRRFWHNREGACLLAAYMGILGPSGR
jgi:hypothetical protein